MKITKEQIQHLRDTYGNNEEYHIWDRPKDNYFLIKKKRLDNSGEEFKFIWINGGLWQCTFYNPSCSDHHVDFDAKKCLNSLFVEPCLPD